MSESAVISLVCKSDELELRCDAQLPKTLSGMITSSSILSRFTPSVNTSAFIMRYTKSMRDTSITEVMEELASNNWLIGTESTRDNNDGTYIKTVYMHKNFQRALEKATREGAINANTFGINSQNSNYSDHDQSGTGMNGYSHINRVPTPKRNAPQQPVGIGTTSTIATSSTSPLPKNITTTTNTGMRPCLANEVPQELLDYLELLNKGSGNSGSDDNNNSSSNGSGGKINNSRNWIEPIMLTPLYDLLPHCCISSGITSYPR